MKYRTGASSAAAWLAAALFSLSATAQTRTAPATMTDVAPLPAEDRGSAGAVVLDRSLQRARQDNAFSAAARRTGVDGVGRSDVRARMGAAADSGVADARDTWRRTPKADGP